MPCAIEWALTEGRKWQFCDDDIIMEMIRPDFEYITHRHFFGYDELPITLFDSEGNEARPVFAGDEGDRVCGDCGREV